LLAQQTKIVMFKTTGKYSYIFSAPCSNRISSTKAFIWDPSTYVPSQLAEQAEQTGAAI